ncbi:hypothetical protein BW686_16035 [Pseudomonas syringae]|uniref:Uncharacterized protein n=1 Tax=Pseudomonas syringae TaxID=317 RepID=A0A244EQ68_PSESX|nr:hypothetical protein [Pseudomonas syringae]OUM06598.1 hypothetical protein BW686_16035 [Pseudomonas syringae]
MVRTFGTEEKLLTPKKRDGNDHPTHEQKSGIKYTEQVRLKRRQRELAKPGAGLLSDNYKAKLFESRYWHRHHAALDQSTVKGR